MKFAVALCMLSLGLASAAAGQTPPPKSDAPTTATATAATPNDGDKVICREEEKTGQRFKSRICHTKTEWAAIESGAKQHVHDMQEHPGTGCTSCR